MRYYLLIYFFLLSNIAYAFEHPGCLSTKEDLDRMKLKVAAGEQPWKFSWDILISNSYAQLSYTPNPQVIICAGGACSGLGYSENYMILARDIAAAYQCALRYHISGNTQYAQKSIQIMNAWASTLEEITGDSNARLRAGLYGYQFACTAELMRDYNGWASFEFTAFKNMMLNIFYPLNSDFLIRHNNTCDSHYWANWDLVNMASIMAIGVLCDDQTKFDEAVSYFYNGIGEGAISNAVHFIHPDGLGQWQESGRDQGHNILGMQLMGPVCEIAWNQGVDLYGYAGNRFLAGCEYVAKYNLGNNVPYVTYINCERVIQNVISPTSRGNIRPGWDMLYHHYVNRMGLKAPYTQQYAELVRPEGGGGNYGSTSGGFDSLGFTTLTHTIEPISAGAVPSELLGYINGREITLSWAGSAYATSYNVKRSTVSGGPYSKIATVGGAIRYFVDTGLIPGTTYYYVVSANNQDGESPDSKQFEVTATGKLGGTIIGTDGSYNDTGAEKDCVFDGSLKNYFDGPYGSSWAGLDLGFGVNAAITKVKYCPRDNFASRMVGGKFQGSNVANFSSGVTTLFMITSAPKEGVLTEKNITSAGSFRYLRYISPTSGWGNTAEVQFYGDVTGITVPSVPTKFSVQVQNGFNAQLQWQTTANAEKYCIKRANTSGGPYTIIDYVSNSSYLDTSLQADSCYYYVITALNSAGESAVSDEASVSTMMSGPDLVAYYAMEGSLADSSRNGYQATPLGSPVLAGGYTGEAIDLDGIEDYFALPDGVVSFPDISIVSWVYWDGGSNWQRIFDFGNNTSQYMFLTPSSSSGTLRFSIKNSGSEQYIETTKLDSGKWMHVAVTLGNARAALYVNGAFRAVKSIAISPEDFKPKYNYVGNSQWPEDPLFDGRIDDFRVYNFALSSSQVASLYNGNTDPVFSENPIANNLAIEQTDYSGVSLTHYCSDSDVSFEKVNGPEWLTVLNDGALSGKPEEIDVGDNVFTVSVTDSGGLFDTARMKIRVANVYSGVLGYDDLLGISSNWLESDCEDVPSCDGADLDGDSDVDIRDFSVLSYNWLKGSSY